MSQANTESKTQSKQWQTQYHIFFLGNSKRIKSKIKKHRWLFSGHEGEIGREGFHCSIASARPGFQDSALPLWAEIPIPSKDCKDRETTGKSGHRNLSGCGMRWGTSLLSCDIKWDLFSSSQVSLLYGVLLHNTYKCSRILGSHSEGFELSEK